MRKFISLFAVCFLMAAAVSAKSVLPLGGDYMQTTDFYGARVYRVHHTTVPQNIIPAANGMSAYTNAASSSVETAVLIYAVSISTGNKYFDHVLLIDSNSTGAYSIRDTNPFTAVQNLFVNDLDTTTVAAQNPAERCTIRFNPPLYLSRGAVIYNSTPAIRTDVYYNYLTGNDR